MLVLDNEVVKVVSQVVRACRPAMTIEDPEETDLRPLNGYVTFLLGFEDVQDYRDAVLVVLTDDTLVRVGCVRADLAALLLASLRRLMILEEDCLRVKWWGILSKE